MAASIYYQNSSVSIQVKLIELAGIGKLWEGVRGRREWLRCTSVTYGLWRSHRDSYVNRGVKSWYYGALT